MNSVLTLNIWFFDLNINKAITEPGLLRAVKNVYDPFLFIFVNTDSYTFRSNLNER